MEPGMSLTAVRTSHHFHHTRLVKEVDMKVCPGPRGGDLDPALVQGCQVHTEEERVGCDRLLQLFLQNTIYSMPANVSPSGGQGLCSGCSLLCPQCLDSARHTVGAQHTRCFYRNIPMPS